MHLFDARPSQLLLVAALIYAQLAAGAEAPGVTNAARAQMNYMLNCQGCHGPQAEGSEIASVPRMKDFVGNFLKVPGGREFLVQVPGSANASISDLELAELLNWMLPRVSAAQIPANFAPYTEAEIKALRYSPEEDVAGTRERLIEAIKAAVATKGTANE